MVAITAATSLIAFFATLISARLLINMMRGSDMGQQIRNWGPKIHEHKGGTPTMGGLCILTGSFLSLLAVWFFRPQVRNLVPLFLFAAFGFGLIGAVDDVRSLRHKQSKGLGPREKILFQSVVSVAFVYLVFHFLARPNELLIPFHPGTVYVPVIFYYIFAVVLLVSTANAVNLTDGLDGLASGCYVISLAALGLISSSNLVIIVLPLILATLGFLWYNTYPADLFMGDTGAFLLGGTLGAAALVTRSGLLLPLIGGLFVLETVSVIAQLISYRYFGRRLFKISPLHHHFESAKGIDYDYILPDLELPEPKITSRLWICHFLLAFTGLAGYFFFS